MLKNGSTYTERKPRILYVDMAYTVNMVRDRGLEQEFASRECGGYFDHVWGVHPIADIPEKRKLDFNGFKVSLVEFSASQTIIEGASAYYSSLRFFYPLNFIISQARFIIYLIRLVRRESISIVCCTDPYFSGLIGLLIKSFTKVRLVIWVIANNDEAFKANGVLAAPRIFRRRWIEKLVDRRVFRGADLVAGGNQNNLEFALNNGAKLSKSTIFPNGKLIHKQHLVDPRLREKDEFFRTSQSTYHFIYIGRLLDVKFPEDVLWAFHVISKAVPNCALIMAGEGPMRAQLEKMALEMDIQNKVHFLGNISQNRLAAVLAGCFAILSPLTGRSLVEGSLAGLPIVAYDLDWQPEFIARKGAGIVVPARNWQKMAEEAIHLIGHPNEAKQMGDAARKTGLEASDLTKIYKHEQNEFDKLLYKK